MNPRASRVARSPLAIGGLLAVLGLCVVAAFTFTRGGDSRFPRVAEAAPVGNEIGLMEPVKLRFDGSVSHDAAQKSFHISPAVKGSFTWQGTMLEFKPDTPGYARHTTYTVSVMPSGAPALIFQTRGDLAITRRSPDVDEVEVATDAVVLVQFNAAVQPLTAIADRANAPALKFDPLVNGTGAWLTSSMYRFRPAEGWQPSAKYTVTLMPDVAGLDGSGAAPPTSWSFTTVAPAVADVTPAPNTNQVATAPQPGDPNRPPIAPGPPPGPNLNQASTTGAITVRFNQPVDRAAAEGAVSFVPPIAGAFSWPDDRTLVLRPGVPLARGQKYDGTVAAAIPSTNGATTSPSPFTWSFVTAGPAAVTATDPAQGAREAQTGSATITFATPMDKQSVEDRITVEPEPERTPNYFWEPGDVKLHINFLPGKPSTDYRITLASGAKDRFDQTLDEPYVLAYRTAALRPSLTLFGAGRGGVFLAGNHSRAALTSVNLPGADLALWQIDQAKFTELISPRQPDGRITPPSTPPSRTWNTDTSAEQNRTKLTVLDLTEQGDLAPGFYLLQATSPVLGNQPPRWLPFVVTKTHLTVKRSATDLTVWAVDYATGAPIAGLPLRALHAGGGSGTDGTTDEQGLATFPVPPKPAGANQDWLNVSASRDGDVVFASTLWSSGGGFPYTASLIGSMTTERPIYRPGETVYYQGVVRTDDDAKLSVPPSDPGLTLIVQDARGREIAKQPVTLDDFGSFNGDMALDAEAPAGQYSMRLDQGQGRGSNVYESFQVASFRRPEFAVNVKPERTEYDNGETISVTASAELFVGAPVTDGQVRWRVTSFPYNFNPTDYPRYSFTDPDDQASRVPFGARVEGRGATDKQGVFTFTVPADVSGDTTSQVFTIEATVTDADNQEVSAQTRVRVHKANKYVGVRPRDYVGAAKQATTVDLVTLDRTGRPTPNEPLTVKVFERKWNTVKVRDAGGDERYESQPEDKEVESRAVQTGADGKAEFAFTPAAGGFYRIFASGRDGAGNEFHSAGGVYVTGPGYMPWRVSNDERIELVTDKKQYQPGDVAHVLVPAPFADATGLVTIERQGVISKEVRPFTGNSVVLDIPIARAYLPNVFVTVSLLKPSTNDNPTPEFRYGQVQLEVSAEEQRLNVKLTADKEKVQPRESVTFTVETTDTAGKGVPAELSLALVDEAILSLTDDQPADAFRALYGFKRLGVQTSAGHTVSLDRVADRAQATADEGGKGGGGGGAEDEARSDFRFTAHWEPALKTDANGKGTLTVRMPDTLTTWRLTGRGITQDSRAGMAETKVVSSKPLIVRPVTPRFLTAGDRPELGAIIYNFTDAAVDVSVSLGGDGIAVEGDAAKSVKVQPGDKQVVSWKTAPVPAGSAKVRWSAGGGGLQDAVELTLPVQALATPEVVASSGSVTDRATETVKTPTTPGAEATNVTLNLWPSLTSSLPETIKYLSEYRFESAELTASRILTAVGVAGARAEQPSATDLGRWVQRLYAEQHTDGGWGWWSADPSDLAITAYAVMGLTAARDAGQPVDQAVLNKAGAYLRTELDRTRDVQLDLNPNVRAFVTYALTTTNGGDMARAFALAERRDTLGPEGKAWLALAMERARVSSSDPRLRPLLTDITSSAKVSGASANWDNPVSTPSRLTTSTRTTAVVLWALVRADTEQPLVDSASRWLMNERREGRWASTQESALAVLSLGAVATARGEGDASYNYRVTLNDQAIKEGNVARAGSAPAESVAVRDGFRQGDNQFVITREPGNASGRLYYQISHRTVTPAQAIGARDNGVAIARELLSADGSDTPLTKVKAGDLMKVRVTVLATGTMNYVQVDDYLPAGLEAVDTSLKTTTNEVAEKQRQEAQKQAKLRGGSCLISYRLCYSPFTHTDIRDDRVALFARELPKGAHEYVYFARATTAGSYLMRPSRVGEVYFPDVWGRTDSGAFVVEP